MTRGYCGIGIIHGKTGVNTGTLWRSADLFEADFLFTVGARYQKQASDTFKSWRHIPLWNFPTLDAMRAALPFQCLLVGVELDPRAVPLATYQHPERAVYLLGAEDHGLTREALAACHQIVQLPGRMSMNVAVAGSIVLYDRAVKAPR